jgi:hypothetical protein
MSGLSRCRAAVGTIAAIALLALAHGGCSARSAPVVDPRTQNLHFQLLGVDWERVQKDRPGIAPLKVIGELDIPKPYIAAHRGLTGKESNIPIAFTFPGMHPAADRRGEANTVSAIITGMTEDGIRNGNNMTLSRDGIVREPALDVGSLCAYVDTKNPGWAGAEFLFSCDLTDQVFNLFCSKPWNNSQTCYEGVILKGRIGAQLIYRKDLINVHVAMIEQLRNLVEAFIASTPVDEPARP